MYAFLAGMMVARFWRGLLWAAGWFVAVVVSATRPGWGIAPLLVMAALAFTVRRRRRMRLAQQIEWERQGRVAEMQLQADMNARAMWEQQQWEQQQRFAEMQLQAQLNAQALFDEHARRYGAAPQQDQVQGW